MKVLRVKCAPVTGIAKGSLMTHNNRCFFLSEETIIELFDQWIQNISNKIETLEETFKKGAC